MRFRPYGPEPRCSVCLICQNREPLQLKQLSQDPRIPGLAATPCRNGACQPAITQINIRASAGHATNLTQRLVMQHINSNAPESCDPSRCQTYPFPSNSRGVVLTPTELDIDETYRRGSGEERAGRLTGARQSPSRFLPV